MPTDPPGREGAGKARHLKGAPFYRIIDQAGAGLTERWGGWAGPCIAQRRAAGRYVSALLAGPPPLPNLPPALHLPARLQFIDQTGVNVDSVYGGQVGPGWGRFGRL